jgi:ribosomal protein L37AE/L43A
MGYHKNKFGQYTCIKHDQPMIWDDKWNVWMCPKCEYEVAILVNGKKVASKKL